MMMMMIMIIIIIIIIIITIIIIIINCYKLYNITTLMAKCRIDGFRLIWTGSICHMFLNVEFSNVCRFRVFQCHFLTVSRFHSRVFSHPSVDTDEQSTGSCSRLYQTFQMLWQIFRADNVFVHFYFATL